jgi:hypothetical protein
MLELVIVLDLVEIKIDLENIKVGGKLKKGKIKK